MQSIFDLRDDKFFLDGLPPDYRGLILNGAISTFAQNPSGLIVFQNFQRSDFAIQLSIYKFFHLVRSILRPTIFPFGAILALKNNFKSTMSEMGTFNLKEGQFSFLHYGYENILVEFKGGKEYHFLEITYTPEMLSQTLAYFPSLFEQYQKAATSSSASLLSSQQTLSEKALKIVHDLVHSRYSTAVNEEYFEDKVRDYLLVLMANTSKTEETRVHLGTEEKDSLHKLIERMKLYPHGKFPISKLAREMGMNTMTFKLVFKQEYHKGIFEFHLDQRMKEGRRLLKESDLNVKTIARIVGYDRTTSFITKFREYFGYPPSQVQKKK
jgi:AraC-like DNA-binding protein